MSHFSQIKTKMTDKKYIKMALEDMNMKYLEGDQYVTGFAKQKTQVDIRIPLPLSYDIGLRNNHGAYEVVADKFGVRGLNIDEFTQQLRQRYAYHATLDKLQEQGFTMAEEKVEETGEIRIVMRRMA